MLRREPRLADAKNIGLQYQTDSFAHRHEVALHIRMGHGQRSAASQLALEQRNHGAGADPSTLPNRTVMQRIPVPVLRAAKSCLAEHFGKPLGGAHHTGRIDRLIGGDQHHRQRSGGRAASATWRVPAALVRRPSSGLSSTMGTCFNAAA